jgi:hypothetical protein
MKFALGITSLALSLSFCSANASETPPTDKLEKAFARQVENAKFVGCVNGQALYVDSDKYTFVDKNSVLCQVKS